MNQEKSKDAVDRDDTEKKKVPTTTPTPDEVRESGDYAQREKGADKTKDTFIEAGIERQRS